MKYPAFFKKTIIACFIPMFLFSIFVVCESSELEPMLGCIVKDNKILIIVKSSGCTDKNYFKAVVKKLGENSYELSIFRKKADLCEGGVMPYSIWYSLEELGLKRNAMVSIENPLSVGDPLADKIHNIIYMKGSSKTDTKTK